MEELKLLGKTCRDIVTGIEGICTGAIEWMYGCTQYILQPKSDDGKSKSHSTYVFEKQLEIVDEGITGKFEYPEYTEPIFFGKECRDKVTEVSGICTGRGIFLFNCTQYILEVPMEDKPNDIRTVWLDEGRVEVIENSAKEIAPEEVQNARPGGLSLDDCMQDVMMPELQVPERLGVMF